jgi:hypothetical protein
MKNPVSKLPIVFERAGARMSSLASLRWHTSLIFLIMIALTILMALLLKGFLTGSISSSERPLPSGSTLPVPAALLPPAKPYTLTNPIPL